MRVLLFFLTLFATLEANVFVENLSLTVSDIDCSTAFYRDVLDFKPTKRFTLKGNATSQLTGIPNAQVTIQEMQLGNEKIALWQYDNPKGRPTPTDLKANDQWFQHMAIIVSDMDQAFKRLLKHKVTVISSSPQTIPEWNKSEAGIQAFYFRDPDNHALEILSFPTDKGHPKWQNQSKLFLGIDHTAIVVTDTEKALKFYRDLLGLQLAGTGINYGPEQDNLNGLSDSRVRITSLKPLSGPKIEFLEYIEPQNGRKTPIDSRPNDLWHWHITMRSEKPLSFTFASPKPLPDLSITNGLFMQDPDLHTLLLHPIITKEHL